MSKNERDLWLAGGAILVGGIILYNWSASSSSSSGSGGAVPGQGYPPPGITTSIQGTVASVGNSVKAGAVIGTGALLSALLIALF